jgi:hypothetical protein
MEKHDILHDYSIRSQKLLLHSSLLLELKLLLLHRAAQYCISASFIHRRTSVVVMRGPPLTRFFRSGVILSSTPLPIVDIQRARYYVDHHHSQPSFTIHYASITVALPRSRPQCDRRWCIAVGRQRRVEAACIRISSERYSHAVQGPVLPSLQPRRKHAPRLQPLAEERRPQLLVQNPAENTRHMSVLPGVLCLFLFFIFDRTVC